jgi:hypothetical protein
MRRVLLLSMVCLTLLSVGCASVKVMKVVDGQPQPEGIPFYMPRPYVQVFEPFVVSSEVFLATGVLSPDGHYLLIDSMKGDLGGALVAKAVGGTPLRVPIGEVRVRSPGRSGGLGGPQAGDTGSGDAPASTNETKAAAPKSATDASDKSPVGQYSASVTQSNVPFPAILGRRFFDVVWMPDFDEKYVVQGRQGLGNANVGVTMVQGWGLYGLDARVDNDALVRPLLDFYSTGLEALSKLAKSKILPASLIAGAPQSGDDGNKTGSPRTALAPRVPVSVKITKVLVAAPGLYPVLKPKEISTVNEASAAGKSGARMHLPLRPYSNIAFNVYEVLVVEAAKAEGDSPMNLQRYFDTDAQGNTVATPGPSFSGDQKAFDADEFTARLNGLLASERGADGGFFVVSDVKAEGKALKVTATLTGGKQKPARYPTPAALKLLLSIQSKQFPVANITLTER